jgi:hypothetical protein
VDVAAGDATRRPERVDVAPERPARDLPEALVRSPGLQARRDASFELAPFDQRKIDGFTGAWRGELAGRRRSPLHAFLPAPVART